MADRHAEPSPVATAGAVFAGRYRLIELIGRGGMADVFRAEDEVLHRQVALKAFRMDTAGNDRRRVDAEVRTLASLRHPGLVTVFDAGTVDGGVGEITPFLVMEFVAGPTLAQRLAESPLGVEQTAYLGASLAATLGHVHAHGVVHRDVKPANVLLDTAAAGPLGFSPKLTDFGIARLANSTRLTQHGMMIGTANYLSPEQVEGESAGPASDVYSLGLVLIECLTGELAYPGVGIDAAVARLHAPPRIPTRFGTGWAQLVGAMTERTPTARPTTDEVAAALSHVYARAAAVPPLAPTPATALLDVGSRRPGSTALLTLPSGGAPPSGGALPSPARRSGAALTRRAVRSRGLYVAAAAVLAAGLLALLIGSLSSHAGSGSPGPAPSYPSVPSQLGSTPQSPTRQEATSPSTTPRPEKSKHKRGGGKGNGDGG